MTTTYGKIVEMSKRIPTPQKLGAILKKAAELVNEEAQEKEATETVEAMEDAAEKG